MPSINRGYYEQHGLFESELIDWCKQFCNRNSIVLDIGAHTGSYAISLARFARRVCAFEPQKQTYYALCGGVALSGLPNVDCYQFGLGDVDQVGARSLYVVSRDGGGSTVHAPVETENIHATETIEIRTLDSLELGLNEPISFIKMDVEENEFHVLKGGVRTLIRHYRPPILFEQNNATDTRVRDFLEDELGYIVSRAHPSAKNMYLATRRL